MPLYLLGHKMLSWYPYVPIGGEMGVNCAILSYNGMAYFGFTCDVNAVPDPAHLEKFVTTSFAELLRSSRNVVKPVVEEPTTRPKRKRPNSTIPLTATKKKTSGKMPIPPSEKAGPSKKSVKRVSPVVSKETTQPVSNTRPPEAVPATQPEHESAKTLAATGD